MNKEIRAVDIINFKKVSEYLTGKSFNIRSDRGFGIHKSNVDELIEAVEYWMSDIVEEVEKPKWKKEAEKKSNPADNDSLEVVVENNPPKWAKKHKQVVKNQVSVDKNESESMSDLAITVNGKKKVDMDALRKIASGEGLKGEFQLTKKKVDIEEKYDFVYAKNIPDQDDQIAVDKKGIAFYSKYDLGVFYVKWEGKYIRFDEKAEFDRFANDNLIML